MKNYIFLAYILLFISQQHTIACDNYYNVLKYLQPVSGAALTSYLILQDTKKELTNEAIVSAFMALRHALQKDEPKYFPAFDWEFIRLLQIPQDRQITLDTLVERTNYNANIALQQGENPEIYFAEMDDTINLLPVEEQLFTSIRMDQTNP